MSTDARTVPQIRVVSPSWQLGPEHPDYEASGPYSYVMLRPERRVRNTNGKRGLTMGRRYLLTARGAAAVTTSADAALPAPAACAQNATTGTPGHHDCRIWCGVGCLPLGWVQGHGRVVLPWS